MIPFRFSHFEECCGDRLVLMVTAILGVMTHLEGGNSTLHVPREEQPLSRIGGQLNTGGISLNNTCREALPLFSVIL